MQKHALPQLLLPGIPSAPTGKRNITAAEIDFQQRKRRLACRLPALKPEDLVGTLEQPFYQTLLRDLMASGNSIVADEINNLLRKEERDRKSSRTKSRMSGVKLIDQPEILQKIADTFKLEQTLLQEGKRESAMLMCKQLADSFLLQDRSVWLARHFYLAVLHRCRKLCPRTTDRLQAEIHCLLAYIARENNDSLESVLAIAIDHLAVCRTLSRDQNWQFKPHTIMIKLKRPIAFYGINSDDVFEVVDACTMSLYMIATLLEHELLISLANQIMHSPHHRVPTDDDLKNAHEFADLALQLAFEVRQPVALSSALTRFGIVLRHVGAFEDAMRYFQQLQQHASLTGDIATEAIAYHNMGLCYIGLMNAVEAMECFAKQKELASMVFMKELEGNSMHEIGHLLLQEGHLWEAEESYVVAYEDFFAAQNARKLNPASSATKSEEQGNVAHGHHNHDGVNRCDVAWGMLGVAAGQKLWSRLSGLCRSGKPSDLRTVLQFKCGRKPMHPVARPNYLMEEVAEINKPWEHTHETMEAKHATEEVTASESSWEEGFMFSKGHHGHKKPLRKVGFDSENIDPTFVAEVSADIPQPVHPKNKKESKAGVNVEEAMKEMRAMHAEVDEAKTTSLNEQRVSAIMEREKKLRMSMMSAMSARSSVGPNILDKRPTAGSMSGTKMN